MEQKDNNAKFWSGFVFGSLIGSFLMFTLSSKEGKKVAEKLLDIGELLEKELGGTLQEKGTVILNDVKEIKDSLVKEVKQVTTPIALTASVSKQPLKKAPKNKHFQKDGKRLAQ